MMRPSGLRMRVAANLVAAVSLSFGLLAFTTMSVMRRALRDAELSAVTQSADLLAAQLSRCSDPSCPVAVASEAERAGLSVTFHARKAPSEQPVWVPAGPGRPAHVTVERATPFGVVGVQATLASMAGRSRRGMIALLVSLLVNAVALVIIGTLLLERGVVRRLARVDEQLANIERLELDTPLWSSDDGDEIGRMSGTLRRVTEKLRQDQRKRQAHIEELERTNRELRETREGLARSERLATVGRLAAGVAHEIGNPIAAILGYAEILRSSPGASLGEYNDRIEREARRVDRIVRDLIDFARPHPLTVGPVSLATVVESAVRLVQPQPRWRSMQLSVELPPELPVVAAQEHYATQVLVNLLINAADAADGQGAVQVRVRALNGGVELDVSDDGPGIPEEHLGQVFDPFFTTKAPGDGTGLGLSICYRLMESFGGSISVGRRAPRGAVFTLRFRTAAADRAA
jgi:two-component system NtrC family sensor kinase